MSKPSTSSSRGVSPAESVAGRGTAPRAGLPVTPHRWRARSPARARRGHGVHGATRVAVRRWSRRDPPGAIHRRAVRRRRGRAARRVTPSEHAPAAPSPRALPRPGSATSARQNGRRMTRTGGSLLPESSARCPTWCRPPSQGDAEASAEAGGRKHAMFGRSARRVGQARTGSAGRSRPWATPLCRAPCGPRSGSGTNPLFQLDAGDGNVGRGPATWRRTARGGGVASASPGCVRRVDWSSRRSRPVEARGPFHWLSPTTASAGHRLLRQGGGRRTIRSQRRNGRISPDHREEKSPSGLRPRAKEGLRRGCAAEQ